MWDTCGPVKRDITSPYGKGKYLVTFDYNVIPRNFVTTSDSLITYTLSNILPAYSALKDSLISLSVSLGTFTIIEEHTMYPDTSILDKRRLIFKFDNFHLLHQEVFYFKQLPYVFGARQMAWLTILAGVQNQGRLNSFLIIPNPAKNEIIIINSNNLSDNKILILDDKGKMIMQTDFKDKIDVSSLAKGVYFVRINNQIEKFIKE
ncbi:MAG: T9SS type A sorting domain-containing protein [Candidatus Kapabacteria bacterium]|nr:T9SS type A sorting domain-containing protein [Candidatus Kapabacteria bacterium]